jgi:methyl coenzyme M reductase alpha subunit
MPSDNRAARRDRTRPQYWHRWDVPWYGQTPTAARCEHVPAILDRAARSAQSLRWSTEQDSPEMAAEIQRQRGDSPGVSRVAVSPLATASSHAAVLSTPTRGPSSRAPGLVTM